MARQPARRDNDPAAATKAGDPLLVAALRVTAILREGILAGEFTPGTPLREKSLAEELDVSRNTLREALRYLEAEGLTEQRLYRGAVVRTLDVEAIRDIFAVRRALQIRAIEESAVAPQSAFQALERAVQACEDAAARQDWQRAATAGLHFHHAVVALLGSRRLDAFFATITAQLRLAFHAAGDPSVFQSPWVARDRALCELIVAGRRLDAMHAMAQYLTDSERAIIDVVRGSSRTARRHGARLDGA